MIQLYIDALELDKTGEFPEMRDWLHEVVPHQYDVQYLGDIQVWRFDFKNADAAMLFKLRWGGR
jgi:hypothetical protein